MFMFWKLLILVAALPLIGWFMVGGLFGVVLIVTAFLAFAGLLGYALFA